MTDAQLKLELFKGVVAQIRANTGKQSVSARQVSYALVCLEAQLKKRKSYRNAMAVRELRQVVERSTTLRACYDQLSQSTQLTQVELTPGSNTGVTEPWRSQLEDYIGGHNRG